MRKILVVSERRADYSRFKPILLKLREDPFFDVKIVVTGISLLKEHGEDINRIKDDGFEIYSTIEMFQNTRPDSGGEMVRGISRVLDGIVPILETYSPDLLLSGFDIGANFAATVAAAHMNIPIAHIQGGEITGSIDESLRHAMSKFSHIHFVSTKDAKNRLIRMGEHPHSIYVVGCPSLDMLLHAPIIPQKDLEAKFHIDFTKPNIILIQHPVTTEADESLSQIKKTIQAIRTLNIQTLAILPNNDAGYSKIITELKHSGITWVPSLSVEEFSNIYKHTWAIVGNSSSGIHEAPSMKVPTVNIGTRQQGRLRTESVIDVPYDSNKIEKAIRKAVFDKNFRKLVKEITNPYGNGNSASKIVKILKKVSLKGIIQKKFYE